VASTPWDVPMALAVSAVLQPQNCYQEQHQSLQHHPQLVDHTRGNNGQKGANSMSGCINDGTKNSPLGNQQPTTIQKIHDGHEQLTKSI